MYLLLNSEKRIENRLIFAKLIGKSIEVPLLTHSVFTEKSGKLVRIGVDRLVLLI